MSPTSTSGGYHFRCPTGGEHISRLVETRKRAEVRKFFYNRKIFYCCVIIIVAVKLWGEGDILWKRRVLRFGV
jgi:hypothetical protein